MPRATQILASALAVSLTAVVVTLCAVLGGVYFAVLAASAFAYSHFASRRRERTPSLHDGRSRWLFPIYSLTMIALAASAGSRSDGAETGTQKPSTPERLEVDSPAVCDSGSVQLHWMGDRSDPPRLHVQRGYSLPTGLNLIRRMEQPAHTLCQVCTVPDTVACSLLCIANLLKMDVILRNQFLEYEDW